MSVAETLYISASTNRFNQAADISPLSLVAFGSSSLIALWDTSDETDRGVSETLCGHEGLVTCVRFLGDAILFSADDKGMLFSWNLKNSQWNLVKKVQAHSKPIASLGIHDQYLVTGSSDSTVKVWNHTSDGGLDENQELPLGGRYPLSLAIARLPGSQATIIAIGCTDGNVQIWTRSGDFFVKSAVLSGHEDWVRALAFDSRPTEGQTLILASGAQDSTIRLWKIEAFKKSISSQDSSVDQFRDDLLDEFEAALSNLRDGEEGGRQISLKRHVLTIKQSTESAPLQKFTVTFDALLVGHEAGVTSLSWRQISDPNATPTLLSTSTDSSLILWSPSAITTSGKSTDSLWVNRQRFGDIGGQRLGGFVGAVWSRSGKQVLGWGWNGGWRRWQCNDVGINEEEWREIGAIGGHSGPVKSAFWNPDGNYLISTGLDQTARIHGAIPTETLQSYVWHELNRPQVHGYDLLGAAFLTNLSFVSIADEKVARVFEAPRSFTTLMEGLSVARFSAKENERPLGASVPPLGLSNKAVAEVSQMGGVAAVATNRRPFEGELAAITLWPETEKLFGHGYESISLAVSNTHKYVATACKATDAVHAVTRIYSTEKWHPFGEPLQGHSLTITRIAFSPDDRLVVTVSRDRSWRLYEREEAGGYAPVAADKSHTRIIWDCAWAHDGLVFTTASRDKTVKIWRRANAESSKKWIAAAKIKTKEAATAVALPQALVWSRYLLAIGLENGKIHLFSTQKDTGFTDWREDLVLDSKIAHVGQIHQLAWKPNLDPSNAQLASCSEDGTLRVTTIQIVNNDKDDDPDFGSSIMVSTGYTGATALGDTAKLG